ncbi:hypothetical protein PPL_10144 [Heterostelium album PN500]|uniref:Uncharacterized protein n=1 Tax=Heterostelium pallidum (strain ATCC 26659 / Pp 5 / PN500) TaxID=670386 RepID=D3BQF9_HETP5|nr:hypothetical protein PPL_10144 [Heterostelium album PN500]EFA76379.1 hypothetical protein PPL_10144 [Heterostelium album PN500]|eukprot:XP_020428511.1 hypothetical protein PPL_10144 [Heterostelium album PN500]
MSVNSIWSCGSGVGSGLSKNSVVPGESDVYKQALANFGEKPIVQSVACATETTYMVIGGVVSACGVGMVGSQTRSTYNTPTPIAPLDKSKAKSVVCNTHQSKNFIFVLMEDGSLFTIGNSNDFRTGLGSEIDIMTPRFVDGFDSPVHQVVVGVCHSVAITVSGGIYFWGRPFGYRGELFTTPTRFPKYEKILNSQTKLKQIVAGDSFTLFLTDDGQLYGVGDQEVAHCLDSTRDLETDQPVLLEFKDNGQVSQVTCGDSHVVILTDDGRVLSWGLNKNGALGINMVTYDHAQLKPMFIDALPKSIYIHSSYYSNFVITESGDVFSWGYNVKGSLGTNHTRNLITPEKVVGLPTAVEADIRISAFATCESYTLFLMTSNLNGQIPEIVGKVDLKEYQGKQLPRYPDIPEWMANPDITDPKVLSTGSIFGTGNEVDHSMVIFRNTKNLDDKGKPISVAVGSKCSYAVYEDGAMYAWGNGYALGQGTETICKEPSRLWDLDMVKVVQCVACIDDVAFAITDRGSVYGWGKAINYIQGTGQEADSVHPRMLEGFQTGIKKLAVSGTHCLALDKNGAIYAWGMGKALGNRNRSSTEKGPKKIQDQTFLAIDIAAGRNFSMMLTDSGHILSWGEGLQGQLGHGSNKFASLPTLIRDIPDKFVSIAAGPDYAAGVTLEGDVYMWGSKESELLDFINPSNTADFYDRPQKVPRFGTISTLECTSFNCFAISDKGSLFAWGNPHIGIGTGMKIKSPSRIESVQGAIVQQVAASDWQCLCLVSPTSTPVKKAPGMEIVLKEAATIISPPSTPLSMLSSELVGTKIAGAEEGDSVEDITQHEDYIKTLTDEVKFWKQIDQDMDISVWCGKIAEVKEFLNRPDSYHYPPNITQSITHSQKVIPAGERVIKGWIMYSINFKDYESDRIVLITTEAIHRLKYDWKTLSVIHDKVFPLKDIYKVKVGRFTNWNRTVSSSLRSKVYEKQVGIQIWFQNPSTWKPPSFIQPFKKNTKVPYITLRPAVNIEGSSADDQELICAEFGSALQCAIHAKRNGNKPITLLHKFSRDSPSKNNELPPFPVRKVEALQRFSGNGLLSFAHNKFIAKTHTGFVDPSTTTTTNNAK